MFIKMIIIVTKTHIDKYSLPDYERFEHLPIPDQLRQYDTGWFSKDMSVGFFGERYGRGCVMLDTESGIVKWIPYPNSLFEFNGGLSPDGSVVFRQSSRIYPQGFVDLFDSRTGEILYEQHKIDILTWSPDGMSVFYAKSHRSVHRLDMETLTDRWVTTRIREDDLIDEIYGMACSDDNSVLIIIATYGFTRIDYLTGEMISFSEHEELYTDQAIVSPDNRFLACYSSIYNPAMNIIMRSVNFNAVNVYTVDGCIFQRRIKFNESILNVFFNSDLESLTVITTRGIYLCEVGKEPELVVPLKGVKATGIVHSSVILM
jgi:hypothetical protein